ncbi:probable serine/threonine-protein kinase WNK6 [Chenopodium quinoa]|uniref:probable serine/threonine-protein kinase WNK6 n=1 Tax=Chenopodium quinoa TaxID=63459 RepID=UPI000B77296E|nr:probable serine/threonine-protein kinase WNK6 [Chenopodium quinoa]
MAASSSREGDDYTIMEKDPTGQYSRYNIFIDKGQHNKVVFLGYDEINGIEIAWKKKFISDDCILGLLQEASLLKDVDHENVLKCYNSWVCPQNKEIFNIITELYSCNLRDYTKKHDIIEGDPLIKNWCKQILTGLDLLHNQCYQIVIHSSLNLEDICVVGDSGTVKIGDVNFAAFLLPGTNDTDGAAELALSSEVHCFGVCVLQMLYDETVERPLRELNSVTDGELQRFIQRCLADVGIRPTVTDLLNDPFLELSTAGSAAASVPSVSVPPADTSDQGFREQERPPFIAELNEEYTKFALVGEKLDSELMSVTVRTTEVKIDDFVFCLEIDTLQEMMNEIREESGLSDEEAALIGVRLAILELYHPPIVDEEVDFDYSTGSENPEGDDIDDNTGIENPEGDIADNTGIENPEGEIADNTANAGGEINDNTANAGGEINDNTANADGEIEDNTANADGEIEDNTGIVNPEGDIADDTSIADAEGDINDRNSSASTENARQVADEMGLGNQESLLR